MLMSDTSTPPGGDWEPRVYELTVFGPGTGDYSVTGQCSLKDAAREVTAPDDSVILKIAATGPEALVIFDRLRAVRGD